METKIELGGAPKSAGIATALGTVENGAENSQQPTATEEKIS
jgi:hypothetical protein